MPEPEPGPVITEADATAADPRAEEPSATPPTEPVAFPEAHAGVPYQAPPYAPPRPPPPPARNPWSVIALLALGVTAVAALTGTVLRVVVPADGSVAGELLTQAAVGPRGAVLRFDDQARLEIPPDALAETARISIFRLDPAEGVPDEAFTATTVNARAYRFEPEDLRFRVPAVLVLPLPRANRPARILVVVDGALRELPGTIDPEAATITVRTLDLAFDRVVRPDPGLPPPRTPSEET